MSEHMESRSLPVDVGDNTAFETILRSTQPELKILLQAWLHRHGYAPISRRGYLYAEGSVPVLLVAHLDTVHRELVRDICYNADQTVVMSPQGIGGDDRAGVWMTLYILQHVRCHVVFCEDEEIGCVGARKFSRRKQLPRVNYIVEMDRRGAMMLCFIAAIILLLPSIFASSGLNSRMDPAAIFLTSHRAWM